MRTDWLVLRPSADDDAGMAQDNFFFLVMAEGKVQKAGAPAALQKS